MYKFENKKHEYFTLAASVFPVRPTIHFEDHGDFQKLLRLLHLCNELKTLIIVSIPGQNRFQQELHYCYEPYDTALKLALTPGNGVFYKKIDLDIHDGWKYEDYKSIYRTKNFEQVLQIALKVAKQFSCGFPLAQVCGPISTGGLGNIPDNLWHFHKTIQKLKKERILVFDQMPVEPIFAAFHKERIEKGETGYVTDILDKFYLPLFESGLIKKLYFIHGWESSQGARWEHDQAKHLDIEVHYLPKGYVTL